ncbi:hypothetical protein FRC09_009771 [Ceratobasidium sp. 395]|nr:hypothetical protein FRC09_009771 [Ceratobasidium sp. 395]
MADFFTTTSVVDKAAAATTTQHDRETVQVASEVTAQMSESTQNGKGSNFSMCEIIM